MNRDIREWGDEYITTLLRERDEAVAALKALYDAVDEVDPDHAYTFDEMAQAGKSDSPHAFWLCVGHPKYARTQARGV
jgi:hypothetical protein